MRDSIRSIQFLRFIAASLVVFSHSMDAINKYVPDGVSKLMLYLAQFGASGVHIFFVISGFIMVYTSFERHDELFDAKRFLLRRFIRIYPIYWVYAVIYLLYHQIATGGYGLSAWTIGASLLLLPGYSPLIIGPGWTLSYEVYFYICFGIFMILGAYRGLISMTLFFLVSIAIGLKFHPHSAGLHVITDALLFEFLAGAWIAYLFVSNVRLSATQSNALLLTAAGIFCGGLALGYHMLPTALSWGVPSALLIAGSVFKERNGTLPRFIQRCSFLGDSSYSLYLTHILMIDILLGTFLTLLPDLRLVYIVICLFLVTLCIIIAQILHVLVERKIVAYLRVALSEKR
jgi:exopolysaccharide production protein ExoZ